MYLTLNSMSSWKMTVPPLKKIPLFFSVGEGCQLKPPGGAGSVLPELGGGFQVRRRGTVWSTGWETQVSRQPGCTRRSVSLEQAGC